MEKFQPAPQKQNPDGEPRKAGFEFELAGMDPLSCAELIIDLFGGRLTIRHSLEIDIEETAVGTFRVELDSKLVKDLAAKLEGEAEKGADKASNLDHLRRAFSEWMGGLAGQIVPLEVVTPPLKFDQFDRLERLRKALQKREATGTKAAVTNAFGLHINPEVSSFNADYIREHLRAFLLLYPWMRDSMAIDFSRRLLTYIDPFPEDYVRQMMMSPPDKTQGMSLDRLIDDYLASNPTRNRALDLLPLFAHLKPEKLAGLDQDILDQVKPRPTFHFRLPNCDIDNAEWTIAREWNYWIEVEQLAEDADKLAAMAADYLEVSAEAKLLLEPRWVETLGEKYGYRLKQAGGV